MKKYITIMVIFSLMLMMGSVGKSPAQSSTNYKIKKFVMPSGGNTSLSSTNKVIDVIGQAIHVGESSSTYHLASSGFLGDGLLFTSIEKINSDGGLLPQEFELLQNYPNPFNPETTIQFGVKDASHVLIAVFDLLGRQIAVLTNEQFQPGFYRLTFDASKLPSGVYFYSIQMGNFHAMKKMVLLE